MHIEFLVEESSAEAALENLAPKIFGADVSFAIYPHQGKPDLLGRLPSRLKGYSRWLPEDWRVVILIDADDQDCHQLKAELERMTRDARLRTKSHASGGAQFQVLNRIAVEELEPWFFGDVEALNAAYPRYHRDGLAKVTAARDISAQMHPQRNRSKSFQVFIGGLLALIQ